MLRYQQTEQYEESVRDWKKVCDFDRNRENQQSLKEAEKQLKMSKRKNYYKILGIEKHASEDEIKRAYRKKAMLHHPGRLFLMLVHAHVTSNALYHNHYLIRPSFYC